MSARKIESRSLGMVWILSKRMPGITLGGWREGNSSAVLGKDFRAMADDISTWFQPDQRWSLQSVDLLLINRQRMPEDGTKIPRPIHQFGEITETTPGSLTTIFGFSAENPPIPNEATIKKLDLTKVFTDQMLPKVHSKVSILPGTVSIEVDNVGPIYNYRHTTKGTSFLFPYFLLKPPEVAISRKKRELATHLSVKVSTEDTATCLEIETDALREANRILHQFFDPSRLKQP